VARSRPSEAPATRRSVRSATAENHLIETLPRKDRQRLIAIGEPVQLMPAEVLCEPGHPTRVLPH